MDVRETIRINKLVDEFKKHGIVNGGDALKQATRAVRGETETINNNPEEISQATLNIINRKISYLSELNERRIKEETEKVRAEIKNMASELRALKDSVKNMGARATAIEQKEVKTSEIPKIRLEEKSKPRTGDYQPGDIDIQDIFYCGKR